MRASVLTRAGSVAAIAAIATSGAVVTAGAASATTHARRLPTHLSIAKHPVVEHHHHATVISGVLRSRRFPLRGKTVFLDRKKGTKWVVVGHERTNRHGGVAFVVRPKVTAKFALSFKGNANFRPSHSRVVIVAGRPAA
jgi:hypothetical protein